MQMKSIKIFAVFPSYLRVSRIRAMLWIRVPKSCISGVYVTLATTKCVQNLNNRPFNPTNGGSAANELVRETIWKKHRNNDGSFHLRY